MVASASLGALYWAYELGDLGFALCVGSALFFAQWGWNLRHSDPDRQDQWLDQL